MTRARFGAAPALLALALLGLLGDASGDSSSPTWEGTWSSTFGQIKMTASGSGTYPNCGTISGGLSDGGLTNKGTWTECSTNGKYEFHMSASGGSFTGSYTRGESNTCVSPPCTWDGTCIAGACLKNDDPAPAQPPPCGSVARAFAAAGCKQAPFGPEVSVRAPGESSPVQISPEKTPANAGEVILALRELLFEEEANEIYASVKALLEKDPTLGNAFTGCIMLGNIQQGTSYVRYDEAGLALLKACQQLLIKNTARPPARATGAAAGCQAVFVPAFEKGVRVTKRKRRRAVAAAKDRLELSCKSRAGRLSASIRARHGKTLRELTGPRLRTFAGRRLDHGSPGNQRLGVRWRARAG